MSAATSGLDDRFDLVIANRRAATGESQTGPLLYAGIDRTADRDLQLSQMGVERPVAMGRYRQLGQAECCPAMAGRSRAGSPRASGYRVHPILRFARMHRGIDFGASRGSPILAAADGQVTRAGWAGGYGRQVRIAHGGGLATSYSHMSQIVAEPGSFVRQGQLIGYVGSSGLSTGPHLHYEVYRGGAGGQSAWVRFTDSRAGRQQSGRTRSRRG